MYRQTAPASKLERVVFRVLFAVLILVLGFSACGWTQTVERSVRGPADKEIQIGLYINVQPNCTSGPLPSIRLSTPPTQGKVAVKSAKVKATNYKQCLALEVPAFVAFYRSAPGFAGTDTLTLEVKFPDGRTVTHKINVVVGSGASGRQI